MRPGALRRFAWLALPILAGLLGWIPAAQAAAPARAASRPTVVLVAVPGLLWKDVEVMPQLRALAARSSVGELSVKTESSVTSCPTALLAVSAGSRTLGPAGPCAFNIATWPALTQRNRNGSYDARLGELGTTLQANRIKTVAVGSAAVPMLANVDAHVSSVTPDLADALRLGGVIAVVDSALYDVHGPARARARVQVDQRLAAVVRQTPPGALLMVAGVSDLSGGVAQLHAIMISGPSWAHVQMRSSAAGRAPYVQLIDIAPTILAAVGIREPAAMVGRPMQQSGTSVPPIASYVDDNRHALAQRTTGQRTFLILGIAAIVMMVLAAWRNPRGHDLARWLARLIAPAPVFIFIANAFPWWRWGELAYAGLVVGGCLILAAATTIVRRRNRLAGLLLVPGFTFVALVIDQLTGAHLQLSAPLGDNPIVAGRFSGMGNLDFAVMATAALLVAGLASSRLPRRSAVVVAVAVTGVAVIADGAPQLGNDIGGVLSLVPASLVLIALVARVRLTTRRVVAVALATVVVAVGVALADYSRPATEQTHVGRFVGQVLHGGATTEVHRKLDGSFASFGLTVGTFVVGFAVVLAYLSRRRIRLALATSAAVAASVVGVTVVAVLGVALNDSGITIAAMAAIIMVAVLYGGDVSTLGQRADATVPPEPALPSAEPG